MWIDGYYVLAYGLLAPPLSVALYSAFAFAASAADLLDDEDRT